MCPRGDDPVTIHQNYREIGLNVTRLSKEDLTGDIGIVFFGEISYISLTDPSNTSCAVSLSISPQIGKVLCSYSVVNSYTHHIAIQFLEWPTYSNEINLNNGNPLITDFFCDASQASDDVECYFSDIQNIDIQGIDYIQLFLSSIHSHPFFIPFFRKCLLCQPGRLRLYNRNLRMLDGLHGTSMYKPIICV